VRGLAKNKVFPWQSCRSLFHALAGSVKTVNGFQPNCIAIAELPQENVIFRNFHVERQTFPRF
jgi:hypothetical protein